MSVDPECLRRSAASRPAFRTNNFDLIRLMASAQVFVLHAVRHLDVNLSSAVVWLASLFPGVPIFFFVSGFLISSSYETNSSLIYHMPVVNVLIELGFRGHPVDVATAATLTVLLAVFSWFAVERPLLRLKRHPMHPLYRQESASS